MNESNTLIVNEIFYSIQGESTLAGLPCVFVRLTGCDLRCVWCDTAYAFNEGSEMPLDLILDKVRNYNCNLVEITGGEPLLQANTPLLLKHLCNSGYKVMIETGGHHDIGKIDPRVKRIVDIKCPGSKMEQRNRWENIHLLNANDEVKFVISDHNDYEWSKNIIEKYELTKKCTVLMAPVFGILGNRTLAEWILQDKLNVRFQLQLHKYIWEPTVRGV